MADTRITRLRNLMSPINNYVAMTKIFNPDEQLKEIIAKELKNVQMTMPEIIEIVKSIPDDACEK